MLRERAPAKVNLFLHILGRRANGFHELQSLVAFAEFADVVSVEPADELRLTVEGPMALAIADVPQTDNLAMRAARLLREQAGRPLLGAHIHLTKHVPAGAGLGGGSSDAAATLKLLNSLWSLGLNETALQNLGMRLGADVPVCLRGAPSFVEGIGERLSAAPCMPPLWLVIAYTGKPLATPPVFQSLRPEEWSKTAPPIPKSFADAEGLVSFLEQARNDLEGPALRLQPEIAKLMNDLRSQPGCRLAHMSGSGSACFGLFDDEHAAKDAARSLEAKGWWAVATRLINAQ